MTDMNEFIKEGFRELREEELSQFEANEEIQNIIRSTSAKYKTLRLGDVDIRIRNDIPRHVRKVIAQIEDTGDESDTNAKQVENAELAAYTIMSALCVDAPFNTIAAWRYLDDTIGNVLTIAKQTADELRKHDEKLIEFRRKR